MSNKYQQYKLALGVGDVNFSTRLPSIDVLNSERIQDRKQKQEQKTTHKKLITKQKKQQIVHQTILPFLTNQTKSFAESHAYQRGIALKDEQKQAMEPSNYTETDQHAHPGQNLHFPAVKFKIKVDRPSFEFEEFETNT